MTDEPLPHNQLNGITAGVWRRGDVVHKRLTAHGDGLVHWRPSWEPRHYNYWRREAEVYASGLPGRLGLGAPRLLGIDSHPGGDLELRLEAVAGRSGAALEIGDLAAAARELGRAQGRAARGDEPWRREPWMSHRYLRRLLDARAVDHELLDDDAAWAQPLARAHLAPHRAALCALHEHREWLLRVIEALPRTICHLDAWPNNIIRRPDGSILWIDWAFVGDGALGEDIGNLVPDAVFDLLRPWSELEQLEAQVFGAYVAGLRDGGWDGDERLVRLGMCASAVKYDWLTVFCLARAGEAEHVAYGTPSDGDTLFAARGAGLGLLGRWVAEAERLASELELAVPATPAGGRRTGSG